MATQPLYGDPASKALVWNKWAVLLGSTTSAVPTAPAAFTLNDPDAGTPVTGEWDPVGALLEDNPFGDGAETINVTNHTAAGFGVYAKTFRDQEETIEFTALETTLVTLGIIFDASGLTQAGATISGTLKQRDPSKHYLLGFQRENASQMERRISTNYAQIASVTRNTDSARSTFTVSATVYPTATKELYDYYLGPKS